MQKKYQTPKMKIIINGDYFRNKIGQENEGIIYQNNYPNLKEVMFSYFSKDYTVDELYSDAVAKFTIKSKLPF